MASDINESTSKYVDVKLTSGQTVRLSTETTGSGKTLIFLHGWLHSSKRWEEVTDLLEDCRKIRIDLPGFGKSPPLPNEHQNIDYYVEIVSAYITKLRNTQIECIIADSLGGILILKHLNKGNLLDYKIIISGCPAFGLSKSIKVAVKIKGLVWLSLTILQSLNLKISYRLIKLFSTLTLVSRNLVDKIFIDDILNCDANTAENILKDLTKVDFTKNNFMVSDKARLVLRGRQDKVVSKGHSQLLAEKLQAKLIEIDNASHTPMHENPRQYAFEIKQLIN